MAVAPWVVSDELWERIEPLLPRVERRFRYPGRKRLPDRQALQGICPCCTRGSPGGICRSSLASVAARPVTSGWSSGTLGRGADLRLAAPLQAAAGPLRPPRRDPRSLPRNRLLPRLLQNASALMVIRSSKSPVRLRRRGYIRRNDTNWAITPFRHPSQCLGTGLVAD